MSLEIGLMYSLAVVLATALALTGCALWLHCRDNRQSHVDRS